MRRIPPAIVEWLFRLPFCTRPEYLVLSTPESPRREELRSDLIVVEVRDGHQKWAHLRCPKCGDQIQLPLAGKNKWVIKVDLLRRPTLHPSIWERRTCGAHFFVRGGRRVWCQ